MSLIRSLSSSTRKIKSESKNRSKFKSLICEIILLVFGLSVLINGLAFLQKEWLQFNLLSWSSAGPDLSPRVPEVRHQ